MDIYVFVFESSKARQYVTVIAKTEKKALELADKNIPIEKTFLYCLMKIPYNGEEMVISTYTRD